MNCFDHSASGNRVFKTPAFGLGNFKYSLVAILSFFVVTESNAMLSYFFIAFKKKLVLGLTVFQTEM